MLKVNPGRTGTVALSESFEQCLLNSIQILFGRIAFQSLYWQYYFKRNSFRYVTFPVISVMNQIACLYRTINYFGKSKISF